jgi:hypothetical protein
LYGIFLGGLSHNAKFPATTNNLWKERQFRDYRKANGLCFHCGNKFDAAHMELCQKKNKAQVHALAINDLDQNLSEYTLNQLVVEDALAEELYHLSLNVISGTEINECIKIRSLVRNRVMLILMDSGSSHSFVSTSFVAQAGLTTIPIKPRTVQLPIGQTLMSDKMVHNLEWWCQGHTLTFDTRVLDMAAYDAILGYDWLNFIVP